MKIPLMCSFILFTLIAMFSTLRASEETNDIGLKVGDKIPTFALKDQNGRERAITELLGKNGAVIDFYRSADW